MTFPKIETSAAQTLREYLTPKQSKMDPELLEGSSPFEFPFEGSVLNGSRWGTEKRIVIFMHGWEGNLTQAFPLVAPLTAAGFSLVSFNSPASGWPRMRETNLINTGEALFAAIRAIGETHAVIGHSFGGTAALLLHGRNSESGIRRIVTLASPANIRELITDAGKQKGWDKHTCDAMCAILDERIGQSIDDLDLEKVTATFSVPGLIIHDRKDRIVPFKNAYRIVNNWKTSRLLETSGLGHHRGIRDATVLAQIASFLDH